jgi:hypothetical protein
MRGHNIIKMIAIKSHVLVCAFLIWCSAGMASFAQGQTIEMEAMLIHASDRPAALDTRLDKIEFKLRRMFRFEHYGYMGGAKTIVTLPSSTVLALGHGYTLHVQAASSKGRMRAELEWKKGNQSLMKSTLSQSRGVPAILGGPPHEGGTLILVLEFR